MTNLEFASVLKIVLI